MARMDMEENSGLIKIGFCGAGMVSEMHAAALARSADAQLIGIYDANEAVSASRAAMWSCRAYASLRDMLSDDELDAVFVLSPTALHVEHASAALEAGRHVFVEKPVATSPQQIQDLLRVASRTDLICMPGHNYSYIPEFQRMRRLVARNQLGEIRLVAVFFSIAHPEEVAEHYDGVLRLVIPHHAYLVHALLGMPAAVTAGVTEPAWKRLQREDQAWLVLEYPPRAIAILYASLAADDDSSDPWSFVVKAIGATGSASLTWRNGTFTNTLGSMTRGWAAYEEAYDRELAAFVSAIRGHPEHIESTLNDAADVESILSGAEQAISSGSRVSL
jgi:predicted dehydrogenase